ncbi:MAG: hypothetical protein AAB895_00710 [Patescibacteria group bacterium]
MLAFTKKEKMLMRKLNTPAKVQDFLNSLKFNFEKNDNTEEQTIKSPIRTLRDRRAHCFEGALLGAYILSLHGFKPYLLHLKTTKEDLDHVITPFRVGKYWGALSKTNHPVLRYREPIYKNIRELVMTYFHEYYLNNGNKTFRSYTQPLSLKQFNGWETSEEDLWNIDEALDRMKNYDIVPKSHVKKLRKADKIEIKSGKIVEYKK